MYRICLTEVNVTSLFSFYSFSCLSVVFHVFSAGVGKYKQNVKLDMHLNDHAFGTVAQKGLNYQKCMKQDDGSLRQGFSTPGGPILEDQSSEMNRGPYTISPNEVDYNGGYSGNESESLLSSAGPVISCKRAPIELLGMVRHCSTLFLNTT